MDIDRGGRQGGRLSALELGRPIARWQSQAAESPPVIRP